MVLNPFYLIVLIYLFSSAISLFVGISNGGFYLISDFFPVSAKSYIYSFLLDFVFVFINLLLYFLIRRDVKRGCSKPVLLGGRWGWFIISHQLLYLLFVSQTGAGIAGSGFSFSGFNLFNYYFIVLSPDLLAFIILPYLRSNGQFVLGLLVLLASMLFRGWLAGVVYVFFLVLIRYHPVKITRKQLVKYVFIFIPCIIVLPILEGIKWGRRLGLSFGDIVNKSIEGYSAELYFRVLESTINRFSHLNYSALIFENSEYIKTAFYFGEFKNFWMNGIFYETYCRVVDSCYIDLNTYVVGNFIDPGGKIWNVDVGVSGWLSFLGLEVILFIFIYLSFLMFFWVFVFKRLGLKSINLFFFFTMFYFYNGWFSPYYNFLFYLIVLSFVFRLRLGSIRGAMNV